MKTNLENQSLMKKTYSIIAVTLFLLLAGGLRAQTSNEGKKFAKYWLSVNCAEANDSQSERDNFLKYKEELRAYFIAAVQRGLELDEMQEDEAALGEIYDRNLKMLDENKPAWISPDQETKLRAVSREVFISKGKETMAENYKVRALRGLELIRLLPNK
ncbi:MAG: hypothetical protein QOE34_2709 [Verrucomicrobiota bacterium]|jgi:hypothetical protein